MHDLTVEDHQALDLLETWCAGREDKRKEAYSLASSYLVKITSRFAKDPYPSYNAWYLISDLIKSVTLVKDETERTEANANYNRLLVDLIRQAMPLHPVVE